MPRDQEKTATSRLRESIAASADEDASVQEALREALRQQSVKIMDLFEEWDEDKNGVVTKPEFRRAVVALGFNHSR